MKLERTRHYPIAPDQLVAMFTSKDYFRLRYRVSGIDDYRFDAFEETSRGFLIRILRDMEIRSNNVPSFARKFVGKNAVLTTEFLWIERENIPYVAEYRFSFGKAPVQVIGRVKIYPEGENSREDIALTIESNVPIIGNRLAALVGEKVDKGLDSDHRGTLKYIEEHFNDTATS